MISKNKAIRSVYLIAITALVLSCVAAVTLAIAKNVCSPIPGPQSEDAPAPAESPGGPPPAQEAKPEETPEGVPNPPEEVLLQEAEIEEKSAQAASEHLLFRGGETDTSEGSSAVDSSALVPSGAADDSAANPEPAPKADPLEGFVYYAGYLYSKEGRVLAIPLSRSLQEYTYKMCRKYGVSYEIMMGLFGVESGWQTTLYNFDKTCYGIGMLNLEYATAKYGKLGINVRTAKGNIEASCAVLADKLKEFDGNLMSALMAYNAGSGGASRLISKGITGTSYSNAILVYAYSLLTQEQYDAMK